MPLDRRKWLLLIPIAIHAPNPYLIDSSDLCAIEASNRRNLSHPPSDRELEEFIVRCNQVPSSRWECAEFVSVCSPILEEKRFFNFSLPDGI